METKTLKFPVLHNGEPRELQQIEYKKYKKKTKSGKNLLTFTMSTSS